MFSKLALLLPAACLALAACSTPTKRIGQEDVYLGESVRYNAAVHTINPDPVYPEDGAQPGSSGDKAAAAVKRYRNDQAIARHNREAKQGSAISTTGGSSGGPQ